MAGQSRRSHMVSLTGLRGEGLWENRCVDEYGGMEEPGISPCQVSTNAILSG